MIGKVVNSFLGGSESFRSSHAKPSEGLPPGLALRVGRCFWSSLASQKTLRGARKPFLFEIYGSHMLVPAHIFDSRLSRCRCIEEACRVVGPTAKRIVVEGHAATQPLPFHFYLSKDFFLFFWWGRECNPKPTQINDWSDC